MTVIGNVLFYRMDLDDDLRRLATDGLRQEVDRLQDGDFAQHTDEKLVEQVVAKASMTPLEVAFDKATSKVEERTKGFRATKAIPFKGSRHLWDMKTNPRTINPPHGEIGIRELVIGKEVSEPDADPVKQYIDGVVAKLREYLDYQEAQIRQHNGNLPALALPLVQQRRVRLAKAADLRKKLEE